MHNLFNIPGPNKYALDGFKSYENEDDATKDLAEFSLANAIFAALTEGHACEQSSRFVPLLCHTTVLC